MHPSTAPRPLTYALLALVCLAAGPGCGGAKKAAGTPVAPLIAWTAPAPVAYGTPLGIAQLNATTNAAGTFTYSPAAGTILAAGAHTLTATFAPSDPQSYTTASASVTLQVNRATPAIAWPSPAAVPLGTALSSAQLSAIARGTDGSNLAGTAVYTPPAGTALFTPGTVSLSVTFTPTDSANYTAGTAAITLWVLAPLTTAKYAWQSVKIIDGGVMPGIVTHPVEPGLMYIRADVGGVYRWDASANAWIPLMDFISAADGTLMSVESIAIDPSDPSRVYIAAGTSPYWAINAAVFASSDRGGSFTRFNLPFKLGGNDIGHMAGERLAVNPFSPNELYLGTRGNGLWRSTDHGLTWSQAASFPITSSTDQVGLPFIRFDPRHNGTAFVAAFTGGLYRTTDGGATWQPVPGQPTTLPNGDALRPMRSAFAPDGTLYLTYSNSADFTGINNGAVYKLKFDGTWTNITPRGPNGETNLWYGFCAVSADAQHGGTVMVATWNRWSGDTIYRSTDGGTTWRSLRESFVLDGSLSPWVNYGTDQATFGIWTATLEIDPFDSNHAIFQGGNSLWATNDLTNADSAAPVHWHIGANGIEETVVLSLISPPFGAHLLSGVGDEGGFRHDDFHISPPAFLNPLMTEASFLDFAQSNPSLIARVGLLDYNATVAGAYSQDGGTSWTQFPANPPGLAGSPHGALGSMIALSSDGATFVWAPITAGPAFSRDRGASWTPSAGAPAKLRVVADRVNPNKFYGWDGSTGTVYASTDGGATFVARATGLPNDQGNPGWTNQAYPKTAPGSEGDLWLPLTNGLYHSTDSGATFTRIGTIESASLLGLGMPAPGSQYPALYAVGTVTGIYGIFRSDDAGITWTRINDDAHQFGSLDVIAGDPRIYGRVYLGTSGRGILYGDISPVGIPANGRRTRPR
jgi:photosystem II stability/assembly factor-like uncharacterized protein